MRGFPRSGVLHFLGAHIIKIIVRTWGLYWVPLFVKTTKLFSRKVQISAEA